MIKKLIVTGCVEALVLAVTAMISWDFIRAHDVWIALGAMAVLMFVAVYEWWANRTKPKAQGAAGHQATSMGNGSPAFAAGRDIHYHPAPAPLQERKNPHGSYDIEKLTKGLERALTSRTQGDPGPPLNQKTADRMGAVASPKPDLTLNELLPRVYHKLGGEWGDPSLNERFYQKVDLAGC